FRHRGRRDEKVVGSGLQRRDEARELGRIDRDLAPEARRDFIAEIDVETLIAAGHVWKCVGSKRAVDRGAQGGQLLRGRGERKKGRGGCNPDGITHAISSVDGWLLATIAIARGRTSRAKVGWAKSPCITAPHAQCWWAILPTRSPQAGSTAWANARQIGEHVDCSSAFAHPTRTLLLASRTL